MSERELPHQLKRGPCSKCKSKDRVRVCSPCYAHLRDENESFRNALLEFHDVLSAGATYGDIAYILGTISRLTHEAK